MKLRTPITLVIALVFTFSTITAQTREGWRSVRTNHLFVIGNADPENLRRVAVWLEFFHAAFARLVSRNVIDSSVPTTVIVFRDDASFTPFKPVYNGRPASISGFFLPGDDVNYIALSLDPRGDTYATAFHEYVHLHIKDNVPGAPLWLNEGLAELYEALEFSGSDAIIGMPDQNYLYLLRQREMLPLKTLFSIGPDSPHYNERDKAGIFYGESWALVHYLMFGDRAQQDQFRKFLQRIGSGDDAAKAIEATYGTTLDVIEQELQSYVRRGNLTAQRITGIANPEAYRSYTATQRSGLTDSEAYYYLSDLSLHMGRYAVAERGFKEAIAQDPGFLPAYAALGSMYVEQRRYAEAKKYLQKATSSPQNYLVHYYYAFVLSREGMSANGEVSQYSRENAAVMREQLLQSIKLAPNYAPAYYLLGVVDFLSDQTDEALRWPKRRSNYHHQTRTTPSWCRTSNNIVPAARRRVRVASRLRVTRSPSQRERQLRACLVARVVQWRSTMGSTVDSSGALPTIDDVLNKYMQAIGGAAAVNAVTSRVVKGTVDIVGVSRGGTFEIYTLHSNKSVSIIKPAGAELGTMRSDADFYSIINLKNNYAKFTLVGKSKIGYREVYVIDLQPVSGAVERLFVDAESYLPVRMNTARAEIYFDDWRETGGLKMPHVITQTFQKRTMTLTVKEVKYNVPVDARIFEKP